ncbi:MAG: NAD(P)-dependent oxidoreductase, partial [Candidatus Neomarinimicrobiota bacterium]
MRIFLTGASGFIGKNLVGYLLERDCRLTCLLRNPARLPESLRSRVNVITGDLTLPDAQLERAVADAEAVIHLAGQLWSHTFEDYDRVNRRGTEALVKVTAPSVATVRRFVMVSSLAAAGPAKMGQPLTESSPPAPVSWYGKTKLAGEQALKGAPFPWTVLRPCMVYGPHDRGLRRFFTLAARHIRPLLHRGHMEVSLV